jgi:TolB-like protein
LRQLVSGSLARRISFLLVTALVLPLLVLAMPLKQAHAQLDRLPTVAVLDFGVLTGSKTSAILGRSATDAVVVEMTRTGRFDVTPRTQLNQELQDLGLTPPLSNNGIQKLGQALGVDRIASGDVTNISFTDNPRRARVTLSVRLTDVISGELANGAITTGFSSPAPAGLQPDDETLINQGLQDAAFSAIKEINNYTLPEATVLQNTGTKEVILNRGARDGIVTGQQMIVVRGHDLIGRIRVSQVNPSDSVASVLDYGKGIRPEDRARAVFQLPGYDVTADGQIVTSAPDLARYSPRAHRSRPVLKTIFQVAAAMFIATLLFDKNSRNAGNGISGVKAQPFTESSIAAATPDGSAARVRITWSTSADIPFGNILEYHIFRDESIIGVTKAGTQFFVDSPTFGQYGNTVTYTTVTGSGDISNPGPGNNTGGGSGGGTNTNNGGTQVVPQLVAQTVTVPALQVGVSHHYRVNVLYQQLLTPTLNNGGGGGGGNTNSGQVQYRDTNVQATSGQATPLARPKTSTAPVPQNLAAVQISFTPTQGADQYVVEFARDPSFANKVQRGPFFVSPGTITFTTSKFDISKELASVPANGPIFFRVGARNSQDSPGPTPFEVSNGDSYIYSSDNLTFNRIGGPPNPP